MTFRPFISASQIPSIDNEFSLGRHDRRWSDGYFGPGSVHVVSTDAESGIARDWTFEIEADGYLTIAESGTTIISLSPDGYLIATEGITFSDGSRFISAAGIGAIDPNSISDTELRDSVALSVIGRSANSTGDPGDIAGTASSDQVLRISGTTLGFGTVATAGITDDAVTNAKLANMPTLTIKGNNTGSSADPLDLTTAQVKTLLSIAAGDVSGLAAIATSGSASDLSTGTIPDARMPDLTGDVTTTLGAVATTIAANAVTNTKLNDMPANTIKGNNTGGSTDPSDLTVAQTTAMLDTFTSLLKGLAPASGGGTANYLRADGTWTAPPGASISIGSTITSGTTGSLLYVGSGPVLAQDNAALFWDATNDRLGIGTASPSSTLHVKDTGSSISTWRGRIVAGGATVAFLMGEFNGQAWLGAHNAALDAWSDFYISPDGTTKLFLGDSGGATLAPVPIVSVDNATGRVGIGTTSPTSIFDVASGQVFVPDGSVGTPSFVSRNDANTGLYFPAADTLGVSTGGTLRWTTSTTAHTSTLPIRVPDGAAGSPQVSFASATDAGLHYSGGTLVLRDGSGNVDITAAGAGSDVSLFAMDAGGQVNATANGSITITSQASSVGISAGGVAVADFTSAATVFNETGANIDFRVEGDGYTHLIFADASVDAVGIRNSAPASTLDVAGSIGAAITTVTGASITLGAEHHTVLADAISNAITINLPTAASSARRIYSIKKIDATANTVTIDANSSEVIDDAATYVLSVQHDSVIIQSNGTKWYIMAEDGYVAASGGGAGNVVGPASSTDNAVARFDATTGKLLQNSSVLITDTGTIEAAAGTELLPAFSFSTDPNTGIWNSAADTIALSTGGAIRWTTSTTAISSFIPIQAISGSASIPGLSFFGDADTGIWNSATNSLSVATNGVTRLTTSTTAITSTLPILNQAGTAGAPAYSFSGDTGTGIWNAGLFTVGITTGGTTRWSTSTTAHTSTLPILNQAGTVALPAYSFSTDPDTGIYRLSADSVGVSGGGVAFADFTPTEAVFNNSAGNIDFRIEGDGYAHLLFVDASVDFVGIRNSAPLSALDVNGSFGTAVSTITAASTTLDATHHTILADATSNSITINLPAVATSGRRRYEIKKIDSTANTVTIDGNASETIDGAATYVISTQYQSVTIQSDGSNWWIL